MSDNPADYVWYSGRDAREFALDYMRKTRSMSTSYTELSTLARCEQAWYLKYVERLPDPGNAKTALGSWMHEATTAFWEGQHWYAATPEDVDADTAHWLMNRYVEHYAAARRQVRVEATELEVEASLAPGLHVRARIDQLWRIGDKLWLREFKTMGDWGRLDALTVDPQLTLYYGIVKQHYPELWGIMFDAAKTYRWKRDQHPTSDSFQMIALDRTDEQVQIAVRSAISATERMQDLRQGTYPVPNVGRDCSWCPFKLECWDRLAFPQLEIVVDD